MKQMEIDEITKQSLLWDFYGKLLTQRQRQVMELYTQENFSLSEIAEEFSISRQAVHDNLRSGQKALVSYEEKLGLVARYLETEKVIGTIDQKIEKTIEKIREGKITDRSLIRELNGIRTVIDRLEE